MSEVEQSGFAAVAVAPDDGLAVSLSSGSIRSLVVIPAYNEEVALPGVLAELEIGVPDFDVLVVVDGATDGTALAARAAGAFVAELPFNLGIGAALRTGFQFAARNGYDRVYQFDADGQHDPGQLGQLASALEDGADMVIGSRFRYGAASYDVGRVRGRAMGVLRLALQLLSGRRFSDTSSGFRGFAQPAIKYFAASYPAEYMESVEALLLACYAGFDVVEVSTTMRDRAGGRPSNRNVKLAYHYCRLLLTMLTSASLRGRKTERLC